MENHNAPGAQVDVLSCCSYRMEVNDSNFKFESNMNVRGCEHLDETTQAVCCVFSFVLLCLSRFNSNVLDLAATLFTPETPKVFCGLKHFTHPSIGIVVSR